MRKLLSAVIVLPMLLSLAAAFGVFASDPVPAADPDAKYLTPKGAGRKDGSSWENAFEGDKANGLTEAWQKTGANETLYVGAGEYTVPQTLTMETGGAGLDAMKSMIGVNDGEKRPSFTGDYEKMAETDKGTNFIELAEGVKYIKVDNFVVNNYAYVVYTYGKNEGLRFSRLDMNYICDGFYLDGHSTDTEIKGNKDIIIENCTAYWHRKRVVRFRNGNSDVIVRNVWADACGEEAWRKGNWPVGVEFAADKEGVWEERIMVIDSTFKNCYQQADPITGYWNSDGVSGEKTGRDVTFIRVNCIGTTDGGWDMKTQNLTLIDCVALNNKRNFRFWGEEPVTLINCLSAYAENHGGNGGSTGLWTGRGNVVAYNCTFFNNNNSQIQSDGGYVHLFDSIIGYYGKKSALYGGNKANITTFNCAEYQDVDPKFVNLSDKMFYGDNDSWNSLEHNGAIGYHFKTDKTPGANETKDVTNIVDTTAAYEWAKPSIDFVAGNNYLPGYGFNYFAPGENVKRADFVLMLTRILGLKSEKKAEFADLPLIYIYRDEIQAAVDAGILKGDGTGNMRPFESISREEMMALLSRALKMNGKIAADDSADLSVLDRFSDKDSISEWAKQEVANMVEKEIIQGAAGAVNPSGNTTRAEAAVIGERIVNLK